MKIGFIATRLKGIDGVSLEVGKWSAVLQQMGHEIFYCAGELGGYARGGTLIPKLHFAHQSIVQLTQRAFGHEGEAGQDGDKVIDEIYETADEIRTPLRHFIRSNKLDLIIVQNALTIPMNLPLGVCLTGLIAELGINTIAHHHDFYWERQRYQTNAILDLLDTTFPAKLPTVQHVTLNSIAQNRLKARRGIDSLVIPNVFDFSQPFNGFDEYNRDLRAAIGIKPEELFILQPTRVVQRKGIEMALELIYRMNVPNAYFIITHRANDEGLSYWHWLQREAQKLSVRMLLVDHLISEERTQINHHKIYSLWDAYPHADLITYPSLYEGFGNGLLEMVFYKRLAVINRYPVYNADIRPLGFEFIELDGFVDDQTVAKTLDLLKSPDVVDKMVEKNFAIAREHFSLGLLHGKLQQILTNFS